MSIQVYDKNGQPYEADLVDGEAYRELELELNEQVLLNGKGSEREYILLGKIERLERENAALREQLEQAAIDEGKLRRENTRLLEAVLCTKQ